MYSIYIHTLETENHMHACIHTYMREEIDNLPHKVVDGHQRESGDGSAELECKEILYVVEDGFSFFDRVNNR